MRDDRNDSTDPQTAAFAWDLPALRRRFGAYYEMSHIGLTWYAWPHDGHLTRALTALTANTLRAKIIADLGLPRPRIPHQQAG